VFTVEGVPVILPVEVLNDKPAVTAGLTENEAIAPPVDVTV
jgi:hypothetical protein